MEEIKEKRPGESDESFALRKQEVILKGIHAHIMQTLTEISRNMPLQVEFAHDSIVEDLKSGLGGVLAELKYLAQQCSSIYDHSSEEREAVKHDVVEELRVQTDHLFAMLTDHIDAKFEKIEERLELLEKPAVHVAPLAEPVSEPAEEVAEEIAEPAEEVAEPVGNVGDGELPVETSAEEPVSQAELLREAENGEESELSDGIDYDLLAQKIALILPEVDYDLIADRIVAALPQPEEQASSASAMPVDEQALADRISEALPLFDYDLIAEKVAAALVGVSDAERPNGEAAEEPEASQELSEIPAEEEQSASEEPSSAPAQPEEEQPEEEAVETEPSAEQTEEAQTEEEQFAEAATEKLDYEQLAQRLAEAVGSREAVLGEDSAEALLGRICSALDERVHAPSELSEEAADRVAEKVIALLHDRADEEIQRIAEKVVELLRADDGDIDRLLQEIKPDTSEELAATAEPEPVMEPQRPVQRVPVPPAVPVAPAVPAPIAEDKTIRYKRSFVAKIIESDEEIKGYYSELKNAILAYSKVRSQINWTNDRFFIGNDSVIKIGVRGKTLCLYLALDPAEFPTTVYHQKFAGDTKMYELTPMMIKIKSKVAVKRGIRLVDLLMERNGLMKEEREPVDYAAQYFFRSEEELLAEGLIKTAIVDKTDLDF